MKNISSEYDLTKYHIFYKNKHILSGDNLKQLKKTVKSDVTNPKNDKKVYVIDFALDPNYKYPLVMVCSQYTITTKSALVMKSDDLSQTITWTQKELDKYGFNKSQIIKIISAFRNNLISFEKSSVSISDIL